MVANQKGREEGNHFAYRSTFVYPLLLLFSLSAKKRTRQTLSPFSSSADLKEKRIQSTVYCQITGIRALFDLEASSKSTTTFFSTFYCIHPWRRRRRRRRHESLDFGGGDRIRRALINLSRLGFLPRTNAKEFCPYPLFFEVDTFASRTVFDEKSEFGVKPERLLRFHPPPPTIEFRFQYGTLTHSPISRARGEERNTRPPKTN